MIKVSVVVPVYNVAEYLPKCVDSLIAQTYKNIEIILVDDGATDHSGSICDGYQSKDERIKVIHKENGGLSSARNAGIDAATGEYIAFVDSDDFVAEGYIEKLLSACLENGCKVSACAYYEYYSQDDKRFVGGESSTVKSREDAVKDIFTMKNEICVVAWNKLYAKELFADNKIRYPKGKIHEDVFTTYKFCAAADKVAYINEPLYFYVQRAGSIMGQTFSKKRLQLIDAVESIAPFVKENAPEFDKEYEFYIFLNYLTLINTMADCGYKDKELFSGLSSKIGEMSASLSQNPCFGKKHKLTCIFLKLGMNVFYIIRKLYKRV